MSVLSLFGIRFIVLFLVMISGTSCSSPGQFKTSRPFEEARTFKETIQICDEIRFQNQTIELEDLVALRLCYQSALQKALKTRTENGRSSQWVMQLLSALERVRSRLIKNERINSDSIQTKILLANRLVIEGYGALNKTDLRELEELMGVIDEE